MHVYIYTVYSERERETIYSYMMFNGLANRQTQLL